MSDQAEQHPPVRSYVLRQARMSRLQHRAFEELYDRYAIPQSEQTVDLGQAFDAHRRSLGLEPRDSAREPGDIILEIGFGMGRATVEIAEQNPDKDYLGIEVHAPGVGKLVSEVDRRRLANLLVIRADAARVLPEMIAEHALSGIHIFFPDPWPKKRHHKRRLVQPDFARLMASRVRHGGYIYAATDWAEYAEWMLAVFNETAGLQNAADAFVARQAWRPLTAFEEKGLAADRRIYELMFRVL